MPLSIPGYAQFDVDRGPTRIDEASKSTLTLPVVFQSFLPIGVTRMPYVTLNTSAQIIDPNGVGICQPLQSLSISLKVNGVNYSGDADLQTTKEVITEAMDLLRAAILDAAVVIPAPADDNGGFNETTPTP